MTEAGFCVVMVMKVGEAAPARVVAACSQLAPRQWVCSEPPVGCTHSLPPIFDAAEEGCSPCGRAETRASCGPCRRPRCCSRGPACRCACRACCSCCGGCSTGGCRGCGAACRCAVCSWVRAGDGCCSGGEDQHGGCPPGAPSTPYLASCFAPLLLTRAGKLVPLHARRAPLPRCLLLACPAVDAARQPLCHLAPCSRLPCSRLCPVAGCFMLASQRKTPPAHTACCPHPTSDLRHGL